VQPKAADGVNVGRRQLAKLDSVDPARYAVVTICNFERNRPGRIDPIK